MVTSYRFQSDEALFSAVGNLSFEADGQKITPSQVFDAVYSGLEPLFEYNFELRKSATKGTYVPGSPRQIVEAWKENLAGRDISAVFDFVTPDGQVAQYKAKVLPRTNIPLNRERRPSVVQISDQSGHVLYLRRMEYHSQSSIFSDFFDFSTCTNSDPGVMQSVGKKSVVDPNWNSRFFAGKKDKLHQAEGQIYAKPYIYVPEPHLFMALECLYRDGVPRVTPVGKPIPSDDPHSLFMLRPSLNLMVDLSIDKVLMEKLGRYYGTLHALGLTDYYDRQLDHYAIQTLPLEGKESLVVNYDPDFMLLDRRGTRSWRSPLCIDRNLFREQLNQAYPLISGKEWGAFEEARSQAIHEITNLIGKKEIDSELYRRLPLSLDTCVNGI